MSSLSFRWLQALVCLPKALPVARVRLKIGGKTQEAAVDGGATSSSFTAHLDVGPVDFEGTLLDRQGKPLDGSCYVSIRRSE